MCEENDLPLPTKSQNEHNFIFKKYEGTRNLFSNTNLNLT